MLPKEHSRISPLVRDEAQTLRETLESADIIQKSALIRFTSKRIDTIIEYYVWY